MKYGFIGCGNMGSALARSLSKAADGIMLSDRSLNKAEELAGELGCSFGSNAEVALSCDCVFLAVKPQVLESVLDEISNILTERKPLIITMAAGVKISEIEKIIGAKLPIIRIMPNTPVSVGKGLVLYCTNELADNTELNQFLEDMRFSGTFDPIDERLIDAGCALSGCGPAYMYMFIEALADGAVACGLPRDKAVKYAAATMAGSAQLLLDSGMNPGALKDAVCSPGGTTIMGVKALEDGGFRAAAMNAVIAAYKRNGEIMK